MEISSYSNPAPTPPAKGPSATARSGSTGVTGSSSATSSSSGALSTSELSLGAFDAVQQAMNNLPDSRADVVSRGRALAASATYPAAEIISKLAEMFIADAEASMTTMRGD